MEHCNSSRKKGSDRMGEERSILKPKRERLERNKHFLLIVWTIILLAFGNWTASWSDGWVGAISEYFDAGRGNNAIKETDPELAAPWSQIPPQGELVFHACFEKFQCARLDLPMDWNSTDIKGPRVAMAVAELPAKVSVTDPRYGGLLWLQSGGPGESGIDFLLQYGEIVQTIVDSDLDPSDTRYDPSNPPKYFDIIAIDSRGINNTTPRVSCFPTAASRESWSIESTAEGILGSSNVSFSNMWSRKQALGKGCSDRIASSDDPRDKLAFHVNTTPQIADMVAVLESHGRWREARARKFLSGHADSLSEEQNSEIVERTKWKKDEEKLLFWGFSYGTVIGVTFAAMQPHRVERVVVDGVADIPDYYLGERLHNLQDTDSLLERMSEYCDKAGSQGCALYVDGGPENILQRLRNIIESVKEEPIGVPASGVLAPDLITYSDVKLAMFVALYAPIREFPILADRLAEISNRNGTSFAAAKQNRPIFVPPKQCRHAQPYSQECQIPRGGSGETRMAIICTDTNSTSGITKSAFEAYVKELQQQSWSIGDMWASVRMMCIAWDIKPKWRFGGSYSAKTAHPMLFIGTMRDPVTPIGNAHAMSQSFAGSAVLAVDAEGHSSLGAPSLCMAHRLRDYFQKGELPASGTVCEANEKPFLGVTKPGGPGDEKLFERLRWLARHWG